MGVEVDEPRHEDPRPEVKRGRRFDRVVRGSGDRRKAAGGIDLDERVELVA
jgi:hypothetical protein